jgi:hypothetical protein
MLSNLFYFFCCFPEVLFYFSFLCNGGLSVCSLIPALESSKLSSMTIRFSFLIDGSNIALYFNLNLLAALVEFLLGYLDIDEDFFPCFFPLAPFLLVSFCLCLNVGLMGSTL